jgi:hypothetical protein
MSQENSKQLNTEVLTTAHSPLSSRKLFDLYFHPKRFFSDLSILSHRNFLMISAMLMGIAGVRDKIDKNILKAELGHSNKSWENTASWLLTSWTSYWLAVIVMGLFFAIIMWYFGGWWYKKRLQWSGAKEASPILARRVYTMQNLIFAAPSILLLLIQTAIFDNYREAWSADEYWSSLILVFAFWSCWISYVAAITAFPTTKSKARIWFFILPILLYVILFGGIVWALVFGKFA